MSGVVWMRWQRLAGAVFVVLACRTAVASTVLYQTGFEPPTFSIGPLNGKDGWGAPTAATVQTSAVRSGLQAVSLPATGLPAFQLAGRSLAYQSAGNPETLVRVSIDMIISTDGVPSAWDPLLVNGSGGFLTQLTVSNGAVRLGLASSTVGNVPVTRGVWNTFVLELDHQQQTVTATMNGTLIGSGPFAGSPNVTGSIAFGLLGAAGSDTASFDNLTITSAAPPESALTFTHFAGSDGAGAVDGSGSGARFHRPSTVAADGSGNLYVADNLNHAIRKISADGAVTTLAGVAGEAGSLDGIGGAARFYYPFGVATDGSGNVYVADSLNSTIRKITPTGVVTTLAGVAGQAGSADGTGSQARFDDPAGVATDSSGTVYVADRLNRTIRRITPAGVVTTLAGAAGLSGTADGTGSAARFSNPFGIAADGSGNVYVADRDNHAIRKITPGGVVTTLAGLAGQPGSADGTGSAARFLQPVAVASDSSGNVYVAEPNRYTIRKVTPGGVVTTVAGVAGERGTSDGIGSAARFVGVFGLATDATGNVYVAEYGSNTIRKITTGNVVTTLAGLATPGATDGTGTEARFDSPSAVAVDGGGNVYVADTTSHTIRRVTPGRVVTTLAGAAGQEGGSDGTGSTARFNQPRGIAFGGSGDLFVADPGNHTIRRVTPGGVVTTLAGSTGQSGSVDGTGSAARFAIPRGVATDSSGDLYVADSGNHTIRKITTGGVVTTLAGAALSLGSTDGVGSAARFYSPSGVATDIGGNVYVADLGNHTIRKVTPGGVVTTLAGAPGQSGSADGTGNAARFTSPFGVATDSSGNVYVGDSFNDTIRKITPAGVVSTLAGVAGRPGGTDGAGSAAGFFTPTGLAVDGGGNIYVADRDNHAVRAGTPALTDAAKVNSDVGFVGASTQLLTDPDTASSWLWSVIRRPPDSVTTLSSNSVRNPTFIPDRTGLFTFRLIAGGSGRTSTTTVNLDVVQNGTYTITVSPLPGPGGSVSGGGTFAASRRTVTATTNPGYTFTNWTEGSSVVSLSAEYSFALGANRSLVANFAASSFTISVTAVPSQGGTVSGGGTFAAGTSRTVTATANPGYTFTNWTEGGSVVSLTPEYSFALGANRSLVANFTASSFTISVTAVPSQGGTVSGGGTFAAGTSRTVSAFFTGGYVFAKWSENERLVSTSPGYTFTLDRDRSLVATFIQHNSGVQGLTFRAYAGQATGGSGVDDPRFFFPAGVAVDGSGNLFVAEPDRQIILKVTPGGEVTTFAGQLDTAGSSDGMGSAARFFNPFGLTTDPSGNVYVTDAGNQTIRRITPLGTVTTVAGLAGQEGSVDGAGSAARFSSPAGVAVDSSGNLFVTDSQSHTIRKVTPGGVVTTLAGFAYQRGSVNGVGIAARFNAPGDIAIDQSGNLYVTDYLNHAVRKITPAGSVTTLAGLAGQSGSADGTGSAARFDLPGGLCIDAAGNLYVADQRQTTIRKITPAGAVTTVAGMAGQSGNADGTGAWARFKVLAGVISGLDIDGSGNLYLADRGNRVVRKGGPSIPDAAIIDLATGVVGATRVLLTNPPTATSWQWRVVLRPAGSVATLSSVSIRNPTFTPDQAGKYTFELLAAQGGASSITRVDLDVSSPRQRAARH